MNLTKEEYAALATLARKGAQNADQVIGLEQFLKTIEEREGIVRHLLWVQWQEVGASLPQGTRFPEKWPPEMRHLIERFDRRIARVDVDSALRMRAKQPLQVMVTPDPAGLVGWTKVNDYPWK